MRDPNDPNTMTPPLGARRGEASNERTELLNRLRAIIDDATQSVRTLKEENAALARRSRELEDRNGMLEQQLRLLTSGITQDEQALRQSIDQLAQALRMPVAPAPASGSASLATSAPMNASADAQARGSSPSGMAESAPPPPIAAAAEPQPTSAESHEEPIRTPTTAAIPAGSFETPPSVPVSDPASEVADHAAGTAAPAVTTGGVYTLITYPFVRFSDLGQFQAALQRLQGVHDVQVRRFAQGTLEMTARYEGETSLSTALRNLTAEIEEVREEAPYRLRVRLRAHTDA